MRISLWSPDGNFTPLAGQAGVSEAVHSSGSAIRLDPEISIQEDLLVRAATRNFTDRENLGTTITFSTIRTFPTVAEAELWAMDYDATMPRTGTLVTDTTQGNGYATALTITGTLTADGSYPVTFPPMPFSEVVNGRPEYRASETTYCQWHDGEWVLQEGDDTNSAWISADDVGSPERCTTWTPVSSATGTPEIAATYPGRRYYVNAIVLPPARRFEGCSILLSYTVRAGACSATL